jgi:hypothetical protein
VAEAAQQASSNVSLFISPLIPWDRPPQDIEDQHIPGSRSQSTLFPESLEDYIAKDNPVRVVDVFVDELDLKDLGFEGAEPEATGRPSYHPATMLKIYIYGYLNRISSPAADWSARRSAT